MRAESDVGGSELLGPYVVIAASDGACETARRASIRCDGMGLAAARRRAPIDLGARIDGTTHSGRSDRWTSDPSLTSCGGLAAFGTFVREQGVDRELARRFTRLKSGRLALVYQSDGRPAAAADRRGSRRRESRLRAGKLGRRCALRAPGRGCSSQPRHRLSRFGSLRRRPPSQDLEHPDGRARADRLCIVGAMLNSIGASTSTVEPLTSGRSRASLPGPRPRRSMAAVAKRGIALPAACSTKRVSVIGAEMRPGDTGFGDGQAGIVGRCYRSARRARSQRHPLRAASTRRAAVAALTKAIATGDVNFVHRTGEIEERACAIGSPWIALETVDVDAHGHAVSSGCGGRLHARIVDRG